MKIVNWMLAGVLAVFAGCSNSSVGPNAATTNEGPTNSQYLAASEPADAIPVGEARAAIEDKQTVTLVGTIGGSSQPFVDGLAAFTIVDPKVSYCSPDEGCPTPWDYCCTQDQVKDNIATVKVVDDSGSPVAENARQLLGVEELSTVVVEGTAKRDDAGNLTVAATKVFVRPSE